MINDFIRGQIVGTSNQELADDFKQDSWPEMTFQRLNNGENSYDCNLCRIDKFPWKSKETKSIRYETDSYIIVETEDDKFHETRLMAMYKDCGVLPLEEELTTIEEKLKDIVSRELEQKGESTGLIGGSMNSQPLHWHIIGGDLRNISYPDYKLFDVETLCYIEENTSTELADYIFSGI